MLRLFIISACMAAFSLGQAQTQFQGVIKFKGENNTYGEKSELDWYLKDGNSKLDIRSNTKDANAAFSIFFTQGQPTVQMTGDGEGGKKLVFDIPYSAFANTEFSSAFSVEATGKKATFAGYECEEYIVKTAETEVSCWLSKTTGIAPSSFPSVILGRGVFSILQRNGVQGIPLKITSRDFAGNVISDNEVVSIQASSVPDNAFVVPAGYEKAN